MSNTYIDQLNYASERLIENDFRTIKGVLVKVSSDKVYLLSLYPYIAFFLREAQDYLSVSLVDNKTDNMICDIRNGLKFINNRYNRIIKTVGSEDKSQNDYFSNLLRFKFLKKYNLYYNIGTYLSESGSIINNTQLYSYYLNMAEGNRTKLGIRAYTVGLGLGSSFGSMEKYISSVDALKIDSELPKIGYQDFNTNKNNNIFRFDDDKELNLLLLHLLSIYNSYHLLFEPLLEDNNSWKLRFEYVVCHSVWSSLNNVKNHFMFDTPPEGIRLNELSTLVDKGVQLFPSSYRNAMFHYGLITKKGPSIIEKYYNEHDTLFGLVESCFDGKHIDGYYKELRIYMADVRKYLESFFIIDASKTKYDL